MIAARTSVDWRFPSRNASGVERREGPIGFVLRQQVAFLGVEQEDEAQHQREQGAVDVVWVFLEGCCKQFALGGVVGRLEAAQQSLHASVRGSVRAALGAGYAVEVGGWLAGVHKKLPSGRFGTVSIAWRCAGTVRALAGRILANGELRVQHFASVGQMHYILSSLTENRGRIRREVAL